MPQGPVRKALRTNNNKKVKRLTKLSVKKNAKQSKKATKVTGADKLRKTLQKNINKSIEEDVRQRAAKYEVKPFFIISNETSGKETGKKKSEKAAYPKFREINPMDKKIVRKSMRNFSKGIDITSNDEKFYTYTGSSPKSRERPFLDNKLPSQNNFKKLRANAHAVNTADKIIPVEISECDAKVTKRYPRVIVPNSYTMESFAEPLRNQGTLREAIIVTDIKGVSFWSSKLSHLSQIYEIYGWLGSPVNSNDEGNARIFHLKDNTSSIRCVFWEMDRKLPTLFMDERYRCVGKYVYQTKNFHCLSVRPEIQLTGNKITKIIEICHKALQLEV